MTRIHSAVLLTATAGLLLLAGGWSGILLRQRAAHEPAGVAALEDAPPLTVFTTVVFGGFRGLVADWLWLRAESMQEEGRYIELVQLSDWITKLEPYSAEVWTFHAWNMAYNVSVMMPDPAERWRWVRHGLRLLRDQGIVYNPDDPQIYQELGWIYLHKIGGTSDRAYAYYREQLAGEMEAVLPGGRLDAALLAAEPARCERLRRELRLQPDVLRQIEAAYGPCDWRTPQAHAAYWAYVGLQHAGAAGDPGCMRMLYQALADAFFRGSFHNADASPSEGPDLRMLPGACRAYEAAIRKYPQAECAGAYSNFLAAAVQRLHACGRAADARTVFAAFSARFPSPETSAGYDRFVARRPAGAGE